MSANYSVHHFQHTGTNGGVTGGVTVRTNPDGGGTPATAKYFDYTVNFREPNDNNDYAALNETDPIIDVDMDSRTLRILAKLSFIEIVDNKQLHNNVLVDTDQLHTDTNNTLHDGDTEFTDNVKIDKNLHVVLDTTIDKNLHVRMDTQLDGLLTVENSAAFKDTVVIDKKLTVKQDIESDSTIKGSNFHYGGGGSTYQQNTDTQVRFGNNEAAIAALTSRVAALE